MYDFNIQGKQPKKKGVWKEFFENLPGDLVVKNCILNPANFTIYAQHSNLKCKVRITLSITRKLLDELDRIVFTFYGQVRNMDECICGGNIVDENSEEGKTLGSKNK